VSSQPDTSTAGLTRAALQGHPATVLKDEGEGAARLVRFDLPGGPVIVKEWEPKRSRTMAVWARWLMRREIRHYRLLDGCEGIPRLLGAEGDAALILQFIEARPIARKLPAPLLAAGLNDLERVLGALHARRFVHLDLHQKLNTLIDERGHAWLVDLGQGIDCSRFPFRLLFPLLVGIDRKAVLKFRARYAPDTLDPATRDRIVARYGARRDWWPKRFGRAVRRAVTRDS
jgi:hypothetical protein